MRATAGREQGSTHMVCLSRESGASSNRHRAGQNDGGPEGCGTAGPPASQPASLPPYLPVCGGGVQAVLQLQQLRLPALLLDAAWLNGPGFIPVPLNEGAAWREV
jgi:hypothetical protein